MDNRAVSEVVGFVLTFSLVTMAIAIVFTAGFGGLQDTQQAEQVNNVERAFDVLDTNVQEVQRQEAPSRATEMRLSGGAAGVRRPDDGRDRGYGPGRKRPNDDDRNAAARLRQWRY